MNKREKEVMQAQLDSEKAVLNELKEQYQNALDDINRNIQILQSDELTQSRIYQLEYQKALRGQVSAILDQLQGNEFKTIQEYLTNCYKSAFVGTMYDLHGQGAPVIIPIDQKAAVKAVMTDSQISGGLYSTLGVDVSKLKKSISREITRGIATGLAYGDIARNISGTTKAPLSRAKTIVRTEGHRIQQASTYDAQKLAKSKGAKVVKQWDAVLDGDTRDTHRLLDGQIREIDELFEANGKKAMFPGDFGDPAEDCNCRCISKTRAVAALDADELARMKERAEYFGLDKTKDFEEFKAKYATAASERENQWGVMYGDTDVNFDFVGSKEYISKFSNLTDNAEVNDSIYAVTKDVLKHCSGTEHEDMYLFNASNGLIISKVTDTARKSGVVYTEEFKTALVESHKNGVPLIGLHNHPQGTPPSPDDFRKAFDNGYTFGIVAGHNGQLYRYETPIQNISRDEAEAMSRDIGIFVNGGIDIDRAFRMVYDSYGLKYTIVESGDV